MARLLVGPQNLCGYRICDRRNISGRLPGICQHPFVISFNVSFRLSMAYFELLNCNCGTVNVLQWSFCAMSILVFVTLHYKNAPYGRYSTSATVTVNVCGTDSNHSGIVTVSGNDSGNSWAWIWQRGSINANAAWFLQELPSFIIPVLLAVGQNPNSQLTNTANAVLLCMFCVHYFHRYVWLHMFFYLLKKVYT